MLIYLVGYMGSGKTTLGEKTARKLNHSFFDMDQLIEKKANKSISRIFEEAGENRFRELEREVLQETFSMQNTLIACGGGTPCFYDNMDQMNKHGISVYLHLSAGSLFHRLAPGKLQRPRIAHLPDLPLMEFIINELDKRVGFYRKAKLIIKGENLKPEELAQQLKNLHNES